MHPFGEERADLRAAIIAAEVHNAAHTRARPPAEFMPEFRPRRSRPNDQKMAAALENLRMVYECIQEEAARQ